MFAPPRRPASSPLKSSRPTGAKVSRPLGTTSIGSSRGIVRKNNDVIAIAFKAPDPLKDAPMRSVTLSQNQDTYRWPQSKEKKPLVPYYPHAERNRLPTRFKGEAIPYARFCQERNVSQWAPSDPRANGKTRFRTMNMNTFTAETTHGMPIGFTNQGIVSAKTRWLHKQLEK